MKLNKISWTFPFLFFFAGYVCVHYFTHIAYVQTPILVGKTLFQACDILSQTNLNMRILAKKEDPDLPEHTVVSQTPSAHQKIKPHQSVFLVVTTKPGQPLVPLCIGKSKKIIEEELSCHHFTLQIYYVPSLLPKDQCIAQMPNAHEKVEKNIILYCSNGTQKPIVWPDFTKKTIEQSIDFLEPYGISPEIISLSNKKYANQFACLATDQRPRAGTLITLDDAKLPHVQLCIK